MSDFKDFIPEGEDTGAFAGGKFEDYVPPKLPEAKPVEKKEELKPKK